MRTALSEETARATWTHRRGARLLFLFDFDGTLAPYASHPRDARLPAATRAALEVLASLPRVCVGVASGRCLEDLIPRVGLGRAYYAGTGGIEIDLRGERVTAPGAARAAVRFPAMAVRIAAAVEVHRGAWVERKPLGLTVHYRAVRREEVEALRALVGVLLEPEAEAVRAIDGAQAVEVVPASGWTKGTAVRRIAEHARADLPVYAGDGANDSEALEAVAGLGGIPVGVGPVAPPAARHRLASPAALGAWIGDVLEALR